MLSVMDKMILQNMQDDAILTFGFNKFKAKHYGQAKTKSTIH